MHKLSLKNYNVEREEVKVHPDIGFNLVDWKISFGQVFLYTIDGHYFVFRPLKINECEAIYDSSSIVDSWILDEWVVSNTILYGDKGYILDDAPAGLCSSLATSILKNSTIGGVEEVMSLLEEERENSGTIANIIDDLVKLGAGHILKDTKNITYKQQIKYAVFSETVVDRKIELQKQTLPTNLNNKKISPEAAAILSKEAADRPDFAKDNAALMNL